MSIFKKLTSLAAVAVLGLLPSAAQSQTYSDVILSGNPLFYWNFNEAGDTDAAIDLVGADVGDNLLPKATPPERLARRPPAGSSSVARPASTAPPLPSSSLARSARRPTPTRGLSKCGFGPKAPIREVDSNTCWRRVARATMHRASCSTTAPMTTSKSSAARRTGDAGPVLINDAWHHLVIGNFGSANDRVDFYLNGVAAGSAAFTGDSPFGTDAIAVGRSVPRRQLQRPDRRDGGLRPHRAVGSGYFREAGRAGDALRGHPTRHARRRQQGRRRQRPRLRVDQRQPLHHAVSWQRRRSRSELHRQLHGLPHLEERGAIQRLRRCIRFPSRRAWRCWSWACSGLADCAAQPDLPSQRG